MKYKFVGHQFFLALPMSLHCAVFTPTEWIPNCKRVLQGCLRSRTRISGQFYKCKEIVTRCFRSFFLHLASQFPPPPPKYFSDIDRPGTCYIFTINGTIGLSHLLFKISRRSFSHIIYKRRMFQPPWKMNFEYLEITYLIWAVLKVYIFL